MEGLSGTEGEEREVPTIRWTDYIEKMEQIYNLVDPHRAGSHDTVNAEFYGVIEGWEDDTHKFVHDIVTVRLGMKLHTRATLIDNFSSGPKFMNTPEAVEQYEMQLHGYKFMVTLHINTTDPELAREVHRSLFGILMESQTVDEAIARFAMESKYAKMKSKIDPAYPLVDVVSMAERSADTDK